MRRVIYILGIMGLLFLQGCKKKNEDIIRFAKISYSVYVGESIDVTLNIDERYQDKELIYHSDNLNIARFENGKVIGVKDGYVRITAYFKDDPKVFAEALVNVKNKIYNIEYVDGDNCTNKNPVIYSKDILPIVLLEPIRVGYYFEGWYDNLQYEGEKITVLDGIEGDIKLYAKWKPVESQILYFLKGGVNNEYNPQTYTIESNISLLNPKKDGYKFLGWYKNNDLSYKLDKITPGMIEFLQLYAMWELEQYKIVYHLNDGINNEQNPQTYNILSDDILLFEPSKRGYNFAGWYPTPDFSGEKIETINKGSSGNINLYAKWEIIKYHITYEIYDGDNNNPNFYTIVDNIKLNAPKRKGYRFLGWYNNSDYHGEEITEIKQGTTGNLMLYAKWEIVTYNIIYELNGGNNHALNPSTYTVLDEYPIYSPTKLGYTFMGWYLQPDYNSDIIMKIAKGSSGELYLYAKWEINNYNIFYHLDGGINNANNPITYNIEANISLFNPTKIGYEFQGWYDNDKFEGEKITKINASLLQDIDLYAKWEIVTYTIEYHLNGGYWQYFNKNNLITNFLIDFYQYLNPYEDLFTFMHGENQVTGYQGLWYTKYKDYLYKEKLCFVDESLPYFINQPQYYDKWISFFNFINSITKEVNPNEDIWINQNIGLLRIKQYLTNEYFTSSQLEKIPDYSPQIKTYTVESETIPLPRPYKNDAVFAGWYLNENFTGTPIYEIPTGTSTNIILYAKWK